jgi:uncharacterized alpha-E superfamily protein
VKERLKPCADKPSEGGSLMACLLKNEPASGRARARLTTGTWGAGAKASRLGRQSAAADPKRRELARSRLKGG